ncbi:MAG: protein translocase subunit SecD [Dehalococcoidales bacterium]|nr:MAG: protein translocase subunit SecD [Dehalococcoidales bacterium]
MLRRNSWVFVIVLIIFALSLAVVFPIEKGTLFGKDVKFGLDLQGGITVVYQADLSSIEANQRSDVLEGAKAVLENRINPLGVTEPVIQIQGEDRIRIDLPGVDVSDQDKERLARVDILEFGELVTGNESARWEVNGEKWKPATAVIDGEEKALTSRYFETNTALTQDSFGRIELYFEWDEEGAKISEQVTGRLSAIKARMGIFDGDEPLRGESGNPIAPVVQSTIIDSGVIQGLSIEDAQRLSSQLNYGRLPISLEVLYEQTVSPILGADFIGMSVKAGIIGILLVILFMSLYYRISGLLAGIALIFYGILVLALFKLWPGFTLTLAGLGGFILSIGMAVDANVLIFERMKEELRAGRTLGAAIEAGFSRAWTAIRDGNITTLIVCLILFWLGSSIVSSAAVQGFALTLAIGVIASMLTAIIVTRTLLRLFVGTSLAHKIRFFSPYLGRKE